MIDCHLSYDRTEQRRHLGGREGRGANAHSRFSRGPRLTDFARLTDGKCFNIYFLVLVNISHRFKLLESVLILFLSSSFVILFIQYLICLLS